MKYKDLARTFEIIAEKNPDNIVMDYAEHDEYGFDLHYLNEPLTVTEVRELASLGWSLGYDCDYDEEIMKPWYNHNLYSDEEIMNLWNDYKTIHKYA